MTTDTICAISTPAGVGGIAVARVSGPEAIAIVDSLWRGKSLAKADSHTAHLGTITGTDGAMLDQAVATIFRSPRSFTGEDVVELSVHGSRWIQRELIATLCKAGCRLAEPGEYTRRAFASGRLDLAEAEGVADMIAANSRAAHRAAATQMRGHYSRYLADMRSQLIDLASLIELELDFGEEEVEFASRQQLRDTADSLHASLVRLRDSFASGSAIKEGIPVAIVGPTNAGKSSLLNALTHDDRAIVSDIHGTTRDVVDDLVEIGDYQFRFQDTAGLRTTDDSIERIGIERSINAARRAHVIIYMIDATSPRQALDNLADTLSLNTDAAVILALNKTDIAPESDVTALSARLKADYPQSTVVPISTRQAATIEALSDTLTGLIDAEQAESDLLVTNARHAQALGQAAEAIDRVRTGLATNLSGDLIAQDIRETIHHLSTITGAITTDDLLATIFTRFCIGK
ncbi:MAG: tRNA uridine-5-carboxymethylaminomethyl(34) synthesis GTPase MnmE [Bacteroides sp.]|nr:tRNA uridine-5-carboxymethylaminomethyl(34) synthesis GTPase MnmE [Bacteroides sp.]